MTTNVVLGTQHIHADNRVLVHTQDLGPEGWKTTRTSELAPNSLLPEQPYLTNSRRYVIEEVAQPAKVGE